MTEVINVKILHLVLKKKWYEMQERGEKTEEYRELTPYFMVRLFEMNDDEATGNYGLMSKKTAQDIVNHPECSEIISEAIECYDIRARYTHVCFHYGYTHRCFINRIDSITIGRGCPEWGSPTDRDVFIIKHHREPLPFVVGKDFKR